MTLATFTMTKSRVKMDDDRTLTYYDFAASGAQPLYGRAHAEAAAAHPPPASRVLEHPPEVRWNPTLGEWTVVAANRMSRPMLPSKEACPLCPGVLELPLPYQIGIFENRAPAMAYIPGDNPLPDASQEFESTAPGRGRCDIVVYSQDHNTKLAAMSANDVLCLVEAWRDRYAERAALPEIEYISIFENKGREAGMTLDHPHGQIYSFPFVPPLLLAQWQQTQKFAARGEDLWSQVVAREEEGPRVIAKTESFLAAMPFYARYPYEVHIWARRAGVHSLLQMNSTERFELAAILRNVVQRYERMWQGAKYGFPTLMLMQQFFKGEGVANYRFHIELLPLQRSPDKLKYRGCIESGAGTFLNDALPEKQAEELRAVEPQTVEFPTIIFN